jgi:hypothetical protein
VKQQARVLYNMVSAYYRVQIDPPRMGRSEEWNFEVGEDVRKSIPHMFVLYPHQLAACQTQASAAAK